jgi:DNA polymerase-4
VASRTILHVDMDAFFVAVELRRRPELRGQPVVVGGTGNRGVVAAASYEARAFGVHSAMPTGRARRLCPHAAFLPGDHAAYGAVSAEVMAIFERYTPLVEPISLDEAFLDVTGAARLHGDGVHIANVIRTAVLDEQQLTCSVGVAPNKLLAKLASEASKPHASPTGPRPGTGVTVVESGRELEFLHPLPVGALWGVGPKTRERLTRLGVRTVGELAALAESAVVNSLGDANGRHLYQLAHGIDERPVVPDLQPKSIGHEETFARDHHDLETLRREAVRMADAVAGRLRHHALTGRTVTVKVRFHDFRTITRATTLPGPVDSGATVARAAKSLLDGIDPSPGVRLLGVSVSGLLAGAGQQLSLEDGGGPGWADADQAVDEIRRKFGDAAIGPAVLAGPTGLRPKRRGDQQWGPEAPDR